MQILWGTMLKGTKNEVSSLI